MARKPAPGRAGPKTAASRAPALSPKVLADAALALQHMSHGAQLGLVDEIYAHQPNLLASVLVLQQRMGASLQQIEPLLYILMVTWQAMKGSGLHWPLISEQLQDDCLQRLTAKFAFVEGLPAALKQQAVGEQIDQHAEPHLLALVYDELRKQGWLQITTEIQKYLVLAALNLVECVATSAPRGPTARGN